MSTTREPVGPATAAATTPPHEVVRVTVPKRSTRSELRAIKIVWKRELIRYFSDRLRIVTALVQPLLFLFVLGSGLEQLSAASTDGVAYKTIIYPGILAISVLFTAMFSAASIVWDREYGFLREMMVAPVRRSSIVIGKCLGGATVAGTQGVIVLCLAGTVGVPYNPVMILELLDSAAAAGVRDHRVRGDDRDPDQADAVVHGRHPDGDDPDDVHLRGAVPGGRAARLADRAEPDRPADLRGRSDANDRVPASGHVAGGSPDLNPGITLWGWHVPTLVEAGVVVVLGLAMLGIAIWEFSSTD